MLNSPIAYLHSLAKGINANDGTTNCAHCAIRLDEHIAAGKNLSLGPVPKTNAQLIMYPIFKHGSITRSTTSDHRLSNRVPHTEYIEICNLIDPDKKWIIDTTISSNNQEVRFLKATTENINSLLCNLPRRSKDGTAYGLILLTSKENRHSGHLINYYVTEDNNIYFIDAQIKEPEEQITQVLDMTLYREEIFYLPSPPPEGFKIKRENTEISIKQEATVLEDKREIIALPQIPKLPSANYLSNANSKKISSEEAIEFFDVQNTSSLVNHDENADKFTRLLHQSIGNSSSAEIWSELGMCYAFGLGTDQDLYQALSCYKRALEINEQFTPALKALSYFYLNGPNKNFTLAFNCIKKLTEIDENNAMAWYRLGKFYSGYFYGIRGNSKEAFNCFKKAVEIDDECIIGWSMLYMHYAIGMGTEKNLAEAEKCKQKERNLRDLKVNALGFKPILPFDTSLETGRASLPQILSITPSSAKAFNSPPVISTVSRLSSTLRPSATVMSPPPIIPTVGLNSQSIIHFNSPNSRVLPGPHFNHSQASNVQPPLNSKPPVVSSYELLFTNRTIPNQPVNLAPSLNSVSEKPNIDNQLEPKNDVLAFMADVISTFETNNMSHKRQLSDEIINEKSDEKEPTQASKKMRKK